MQNATDAAIDNSTSLREQNHKGYSEHMTKKSTKKTPTLTLHSLIGALSFWGTAVRTLLFAFLAAAVFIVALTEATTDAAVDSEILVLIYVLGSFLLLDFGYVLIARAYALQRAIDLLALFVADILLALLYIAPKLVVTSDISVRTNPLIFVIFIPIIVLSLRMLVGMLFGRRGR